MELEIGDIVSFISDNGCEVIGRYYGTKDWNGIIYDLISAYSDDRAKHWLSKENPNNKIKFILRDKIT